MSPVDAYVFSQVAIGSSFGEGPLLLCHAGEEIRIFTEGPGVASGAVIGTVKGVSGHVCMSLRRVARP